MFRPLVIAHATAAGLAPENSLQGIRAALDAGADAIEFDVHVTGDGVPVLIHDPTLERTAHASGNVADLAFERLRSADVGGEPVPSLAEALDAIGGRALAVIEIKPEGKTPEVVREVVKAGAQDWCMVWSFQGDVVAECRYLLPQAPACLLTPDLERQRWPAVDVLRRALELGAQGISVEYPAVNQDLVSFAACRGLSVFCWTPDAEADWARLRDAGVSGIVSNYPDRLRSFLYS